MSPQLQIWSANIGFCLVVSISFVLYGKTFTRVGNMSIGSVQDVTRFMFRVFTDPYFIIALVLALTGSLLRIVMMRHLGIARTALASELALVLALLFTFLVFGSAPRFPRDYLGATLIIIGSYVVSS